MPASLGFGLINRKAVQSPDLAGHGYKEDGSLAPKMKQSSGG